MKKVSIIIPVYNAEKFIEKGIKSVLNQTYKNIELILINDGSRDNSLNIIKKWENEYSNIIKVFDQKNMGVGKTRNKGIEVSTGDYVTFIDADDYIDVDFIQVLLDNALDNDVIISGYRRIDENGNVIFSQKLKSNDWSKFKQVTIWSKLYKKEFLIKNSIMFNDLKIGEDIVFSISTYVHASKINTIEYIGYNNVYNSASVTHDFSLKKDNDILSTIKILGNITSNKEFLKNNANNVRNFYNKIYCAYLFDKALVLPINELKKYYNEGLEWMKKYYKENNLKFGYSYIHDEPFRVNVAIFLTLFSYKCHLSNVFLKIIHQVFYKD